MDATLERTRTALPESATPEEAALAAQAIQSASEIEFRAKTPTAGYLRCPVCEQDQFVGLPVPTWKLVRMAKAFALEHARCIVRRSVEREVWGEAGAAWSESER